MTLRVTAINAAAELGGTERVLLDFANRAFEFGIELRVLVPRTGPLVDILNEIGVRTEVVPAPRSMLRASQRGAKMWTAPLAVMGLRSWGNALREHPFVRDADVIMTEGFKPHLAMASPPSPASLIWHLHEFPPRTTGWFWKRLMRRRADLAIANSRAVAAAWGSGAESRLVVVPNGVNLDRFVPREPSGWIHEQLGIPREHRLVGMPAVYARWKGQLEVIEAFRHVAHEFPDVHLVLVGGSIYDTVAERDYGVELRQATERALLSLEASSVSDFESHIPRIHLLGFQSKIETVYPEMDVVVHYSLRPEPFGRVIIEAMACGVAVVAAAAGGPIEILGNANAGWLAEPCKPAALGATLREALGLPPDALRAMGAAGRRVAEDRYSDRRFARELAAQLASVKR